MESKVCVICNAEKNFDLFWNKFRECKQSNQKRSLKHYYQNKYKISNQKKNLWWKK